MMDNCPSCGADKYSLAKGYTVLMVLVKVACKSCGWSRLYRVNKRMLQEDYDNL